MRSIIDGIRLCKVQRLRYRNGDMADLEAQLVLSGARQAVMIMITTDGVFSMDGYIAKFDQICDLADRYGALGDGRRLPCRRYPRRQLAAAVGEHPTGSMERVDIIDRHLGQGAWGCLRRLYLRRVRRSSQLLRQRSASLPVLHTPLPPPIVGATLKVLDLLAQFAISCVSSYGTTPPGSAPGMTAGRLRYPAWRTSHRPGQMISDVAQAGIAGYSCLLAKGIYVVAFSYPVVPCDKARIRWAGSPYALRSGIGGAQLREGGRELSTTGPV